MDWKQRKLYEGLLALDIHNREMFQTLVDSKASSESAFEWQVLMRHYLRSKGNGSDVADESPYTVPDVEVECLNSRMKYNYEYLGIVSRLVITPLTDRCFQIMAAAIQLGASCSLEGPAGVGKTETVKDLSKILARHCVVFNCSKGIGYLALGKLFKVRLQE